MLKYALVAAVVLLFMMAPLANAASTGQEIKELWEQHEQGIEAVLNCFQTDGAPACYQRGMRDLISTELALINTGVSPKDVRLVMRLLKDLKSTNDLPIFSWRVMKRGFQKRGISLSVWGSFRDGEIFHVTLRDGKVAEKPAGVRIIEGGER